ncbi:TetR/AcrR family transcriptional regulator [Longispora sp. K20-0274]|uniref:TetR/AcrR family transcriptional regulator n=1 Tax=Longispora sp. K20-0274 TaxID=3088255 RepID=UPI00399BF03E
MSADQQVFPSVWARPQRERRDQPALSRDQIVAAAIELLDADGIDALSMRKLGTRLNAGATSMYSHVANKDELLELVVDQVIGEIEVTAEDPADWRAVVTQTAYNMRSMFLRHPWIVSVLSEVGVIYLGPNMMRMSEGLLTVLEEAGFTLQEADDATTTVVAFVVGMSTAEAAFLTMLAKSGQTEQEWADRLLPAAERAVQAFPRLRQMYATQRQQALEGVREDKFGNGLRCVLDGVQARRA